MSESQASPFGPPRGAPPVIEWRPCCALMVDRNYQRMIDGPASQALVRKIAEEWDWRLCAPLTVSHRSDGDDPGFYVIDGQHRLAAAELRADIPELPCIVSKFGSFEEEARCFVSINSARKAVTAIDKFHARIAAKEPLALEIKDLVEANLLSITRYADAQFWKPDEISFPDLVGRFMQAEGKRFGLGATGFALGLLSAWSQEPLLRGKDIFGALVQVADGNWSKLPEGAMDGVYQGLMTHLGSKPHAEWARLGSRYAVENDYQNTDVATAEVMLKGFDPRLKLSSGLDDEVEAPPPAPPKPAAAAPRNPLPSVKLPPESDGRTWCDQCDRRVTFGFAAACKSKFCSAKVAA